MLDLPLKGHVRKIIRGNSTAIHCRPAGITQQRFKFVALRLKLTTTA
jgi:hypothetical protein